MQDGGPFQIGVDPRTAQFVRICFSNGVLTAKMVGPSIGQREAPIISDQVRAELNRLGKSVRVVVVDLSDVAMLTSMGLGMCIDVRNRAMQVKAKSVLYGMKPDIDKLFRMMRIERLYKIARSPAELEKYAA